MKTDGSYFDSSVIFRPVIIFCPSENFKTNDFSLTNIEKPTLTKMKMIEKGTILQNRYAIESQIGKGGMGAVYLAVDQRFGNHVAIKETFYSSDEEFGAAFEREAKLLNGLQHSVLPHVTDYFTENGEHYLVMQFIEGGDLFEILKLEKRFAEEKVLDWTDNLLDALDYLHSQNPPIIHRDIKPQNLKITPRGNIILLDFGLAKLKSEDSTTRSVFGYSRRYSPLEQIQGIGTDAASDIFSLAATVYHLLTGEPPVDALDRAAAIVAGKSDPLKSARELNGEISPATSEILTKALALNSEERFESAQAMRDALRNSENFSSKQEIIQTAPEVKPIEGTSNRSVPEKPAFPALAAFAAGHNVVPPTENKDFRDDGKTINSAENSGMPAIENEMTDVPTRVAAPRRRSNLPFAAAALIVLVLAGLTAGYFISKKPAQTSENSAADTNAEVSETTPSTAENPLPEPQAMALSAGENSVADAEKEKETKPEKTTIVPVKKETAARSNPAENNETPRNNGETRERVVENVPQIEEIPVDEEEAALRELRKQERIRRQERRRQRVEDNNGDRRERRRRQQQRRRQNEDYFPF